MVGDLQGLVAMALGAEYPFELSRAHVNLGSILLDLGDISGSIDVVREGVVLCERLGTIDGFGRFVLGNLTEALFMAGEWGEAEEIVTAGLEHARRTGRAGCSSSNTRTGPCGVTTSRSGIRRPSSGCPAPRS